MLSNIRLFVAFALLAVAFGSYADDVKSFSKQMNEIKRSGNYIYAESSAPNEVDAKAACDALLKIEITKHMASAASQADARIVKDISDYNREYLVQPRGDMIRVFGYVAKKDVFTTENKSRKDRSATTEEKKKEVKAEPAKEEINKEDVKEEDKKVEPIKEENDGIGIQQASTHTAPTESGSDDMTLEEPATHIPGNQLKTEGVQLAKWQIDMLESIVKEPDMLQAKKLLNRFKYQNRIKRLGDRSALNPRSADSFYLIYSNSGILIALLAPSSTQEHYDMLTGKAINFDNYTGNQYLWFQISK